MATSAFDSFDEDMPKPPIVRHPAFPAVVAAWFATLLGLGTLLLPAVLIESLVGATGLSALLPAAAPPLGATAHGLIAVAAALAGAAAGWTLARRVAGSPEVAVEPQQSRFPTGRRRPLSVREEFGDDRLFEDFGLPFPGQDPAVFEHREQPDGDLAAVLPNRQEDDGVDSSCPEPDWPHDGFEPADADATTPKGLPRDETREPLAFAAPSLARHAAQAQGDAVASAEPSGPAPLDGLGLVDLAERLRTSIERRRERIAGPAETVAAEKTLPAGLEAALAEDAAQAMAAYFGRPTAIGASAAPAVRSAHRDAGSDETGFDAMASSRSVPEPPPAPGHAETDAALRTALANLQRMSGRA